MTLKECLIEIKNHYFPTSTKRFVPFLAREVVTRLTQSFGTSQFPRSGWLLSVGDAPVLFHRDGVYRISLDNLPRTPSPTYDKPTLELIKQRRIESFFSQQ